MSMKMKGLLRGLRYISTIFDEEQEQEMQIGFPTDVKHVAHIGWDGPTANSPSWISSFKEGDSEGGGGGAPVNGDQQNITRSRDLRPSIGIDTPPLDSPSRRRSEKVKGSRRASSSSTTDSPKKSTSENKTNQQVGSGLEGDSTSSASTKSTTRRKKPKSGPSSGQSSSRASTRSKPSSILNFSDPGTGGGISSSNKPIKSAPGAEQTEGRRNKGKDTCQSSVLKVSSEQEDQKSLDDISRGIHAM
ncbi:CRIB domain-containing protein RIC5-like isoform X2 [Amaranthus tricolor]|uniref:CRIB domain-containing protein RIC5-like isoform X2 n=1 Tax=Amaranthus tricolor TaxID=29722 RepID=UPI002583659D|nr:CRIB domain-containing protein RIC5-like isoform X2 [Amaranthus tricolor]